ncbi:MAG: hypothetical protein ABJP70_11285 [Erythrobacter sp.]
MKNTVGAALVASLALAGCSSESEPSSEPVSDQAVQADYDFERQLQSCEGAVCNLLDPEQMKVTDYDPALIAGMELSTDDTLESARAKLNEFYQGMVSSGLGNTTNPDLGLLHAQLSPGNNASLDEYDVFIRTEGQSNSAKVHDWGARVRCAPVAETTPWQTTPC